MIELILRLCLTGAFCTVFTVLLLHHTHMFQLNSYKPKVHLAWLYEASNKSRYIKTLLQFTVLFLLVLTGKAVGIIAAIAGLLLMALLNRPGKAKKPLVYTPRVKRMLLTSALLLLVLIGAGFAAGLYGYPHFLSLCCLAAAVLYPWFILAANALNQPVERHINNGFIREAKTMIDGMPNLTVIGVTGSYGKTSVKFYLQKLLSAKYNVLVTPENFNTTLGVVRTIREHLRATHEIFVCEMGAKNIGDIKEICDLVHPDHGVITSIGPQHLESFLTIENVVKTKFELADAVGQNGTMFLNFDNDYIKARPVSGKAVTYGLNSEDCDYRPYALSVSSKGSVFKLKDKDGAERTFTTKLIGEHNVVNIAGAIAVAHSLGVPMDALVTQVRRLEGVPHRLQLFKGHHALIIDDAYNSNPSGAKAALDTLNTFDGVKIVVTPGMVELGSRQYECNKIFGAQIAEMCDYAVLVGPKQTLPIQDGLKEAAYPESQTFIAQDLTRALAWVERLDTGGRQKIVLLENDLPDNY